MRYALTLTALIISILILCSGCITYESALKIDQLTREIQDLQDQVEDKITRAKAGDLTTGEALEFVRYAENEIKDTRDELRAIKDKENIGWPELITAIAASLLGGTGLVRAWRGPSHKMTLPGTPPPTP